MRIQEYNGWTNYETWLVNIWQDNDVGKQGYWTGDGWQSTKLNRLQTNES